MEGIMSDANNTPDLSKVKTEPGCSNADLLSISNNSEKENEKSRKRKAAKSSSDNGTFNNIEMTAHDLVHHGVDQIKTETTDYVKTEPYDDKAETLSDDGDDLDTSKRKKKEEKPCKLEPNDGENGESSDHVLDNLEFERKLNEYRSTNITGHICEAILRKRASFVKREARRHQDRKQLIPELVNGDLPPCEIKLVPEIESYSRDVKNYEWEKFVDNEFVNRIDNHIKQTVDAALLPQYEYERIRNEVITDLNNAFGEGKHPLRWHCFGSYLSGIVYRNTVTDIDVCYEGGLGNRIKKLRSKVNRFGRFSQLYDKGGKVRFQHKDTKKPIVISHSSTLNIEYHLLMKLYLSINPNLKYLTVYVELIMKKYRTKMKRGGVLPHYSIFWLAVFFMQQKKLLPAVIDIRKTGQLSYKSEWDCSLPEDYSYPTESVSLYSLLLSFFDFYKDFDFLTYVICPYLGRVITLTDFENMNFRTNERSTDVSLIKSGDKIPFTRSILNLQDPTNLDFNFGSEYENNTFNLNTFKTVCHHLSNILPEHMTEIEQMDCLCRILPDFISGTDYYSVNLVNYFKLTFHLSCIKNQIGRKKFNQSHILEAIRKLMEFAFRLELKSIAVTQSYGIFTFSRKEKRIVRCNIPVMYFEYYSSENTWQSDYMKEIVPEKEPVRIYLICEIILGTPKEIVDIYAQGEARFVAFLRVNFDGMLQSILNRMFRTRT